MNTETPTKHEAKVARKFADCQHTRPAKGLPCPAPSCPAGTSRKALTALVTREGRVHRVKLRRKLVEFDVKAGSRIIGKRSFWLWEPTP